MRPERQEGMAASPVLIGAITVLMLVVAVFLAYNANRGLPFVSTYELRAELPNASQLVATNDVRLGGFRVGVVSEIKPRRRPDGTTFAEITMKLQPKDVEPLPLDSRIIVRSRSPLGFKYVDIIPGSSRKRYPAGATMPLAAARPRPVEIDEVLNTFDARTRQAVRNNLVGFGDGLAGRGADLNEAVAGLPRLLGELEPVMHDLAEPRTRLVRLVPALERAARIVAPAAETQGELVENLDVTFSALSGVARPFLQDAITQTPPTLEVATAELPEQRPFLADATLLAHELRPSGERLRSLLPELNDAVSRGIPQLERSPALNARLADLLDAVESFSTTPAVPAGIERLDGTVTALQPTLSFLTPAQTTCNYMTLWLRNTSGLLSEGDANGTWQRFIIIPTPVGPNAESGPSSAPANGPAVANHLHSNAYPNTAAPGQTHECEAGNEPYPAGRTVVGNVPRNQGIQTAGQESGG